MQPLQGKVVLVTGGAHGIGEAVVRLAASQGATVVFVDNDIDQGQKISMELTAKKIRNTFFPFNLTESIHCKTVVDLAMKYYQKIDILVNTEGTNDHITIDQDPHLFFNSLQGNLIHYYAMVHHAIKHLRESKGCIINVASKVALNGEGGTSGYAAANGAILGLTREWATDFAKDGVRVNAVIAGKVNSQQQATHEAIAQTILFLASPAASHTTGQWNIVDGSHVV